MKACRLVVTAMLYLISISVSFAQEYIETFNGANKLYTEGKYEQALKQFRYINENAPESDVNKKTSEIMIKKCIAAIKAAGKVKPAPVLYLSTNYLHIQAIGASPEIIVTSNNPWKIDYMPQWCDTVRVTRKAVTFRFDENTTGVGRQEQIRIRSGELSQIVSIAQDPMPVMVKEKCRVFFRTNPGNVRIDMVGDRFFNDLSSHAFDLEVGQHQATFTKFGYHRLDTTFVITKAQNNTMSIMDIRMRPTFGVMMPTVSLKDTHLIPGEKPEITFSIEGQLIDLTDELRARSFDSDEGIVYVSLYKGGKVPLMPGKYCVKAVAPYYKPFEQEIQIMEGETLPLDIKLELKAGTLTVHDSGNAEGADIRDGSTGLIVGKVGQAIMLPAGRHLISVEKTGHECDNGKMEVSISEDSHLDIKASMTRTAVFRIPVTDAKENVYLNGEMQEFHPGHHDLHLKEGQRYEIKIGKEGCWPHREIVDVLPSHDTVIIKDIILDSTFRVRIRTNEPGVKLSLFKLYDKRHTGPKDTSDYAATTFGWSQTETSLEIPKNRYKVLMTRSRPDSQKRTTAYKGRISFDGTRKEYYIQTYPQTNFLAIGADLNLCNFRAGGERFDNSKGIPFMGSAWFGQFKLFAPGLSTTILKASLLNSMQMGAPTELGKEDKPNFMAGASALLLNYDFRIGGALFQYGDIDMLLSYSWYPDFSKHVRFAHFSGHEAFGGVEVSSRLKTFNFNLRAGIMYFNGSRNFYKSELDSYTTDSSQLFLKDPCRQVMFVIRAGFSLGSKRANGRNMLRVF